MDTPAISNNSFSGVQFRVYVPSTKTLRDNDGQYTSFAVAVQAPFATWTVQRRYKQFSALNAEITSQMSAKGLVAPTFPKKKIIGLFQQTFVEERREALERYMQQLLLLPQALSYSPIVDFLQDGGNMGMQLQMLAMRDQLAESMSLCASLQKELQNSRTEAAQAASVIAVLDKQILALQQGRAAGGSSALLAMAPAAENAATEAMTVLPGSSSAVFEHEHRGRETKGGIALEATAGTNLHVNVFNGDIFGNSKSAAAAGAGEVVGNMVPYQDAAAAASLEARKPGYFIQQVLGLDKDFSAGAGAEVPDAEQRWVSEGAASRLTSYSSRDSLSSSGLHSDSNSNSLAQRYEGFTEEFPPDLLNFGKDTTKWDLLTDEVVTMVQPQDAQIQFRVSASRFVAKHTRKILGTQVYEIGMQGLRCFLPDDPIRLSVFLSRGAEAGWYVRLNEQLCRLSGIQIQSEDPAEYSNSSHSLSNVSFVSNSEATGHKLQCLVDSVLGVEVVANARLDMCLNAFLEDFDRLFGKDHLFKRSLILIRAWWVYEANLSSSCGISDTAFCVMILSVMNRFHAKIHHPFHALCLFLAEYYTVNFSTHIITIDGPIPHENYMTVRPPAVGHSKSSGLITADFLNRYRKLTLAIDEDESSTMELLNESIGEDTMSDATFVSSRILNKSNYAQTVCAFAHKPITIAHPLLPGMIFNGPSHQLRRKAVAIVDEIRAGARALIPILQSTVTDSSTNSGTNPHEMIEEFFKNTTARFGRGWRPDVLPTIAWNAAPNSAAKRRVSSHDQRTDSASNDSARSSCVSTDTARTRFSENDFDARGDLYWISLDKAWERIRYCNLLLESQISESALKTLSRQVLEEKGALPVGEIGKMLQEACLGISNMSSVLKERFGGLKKFLETYPDDFVLANDHPFNPNVYLQDSLTPDELGMIMRGEPLNRSSQWSSAKAKKNARNTNRALLARKKTTSPALQQPDAFYNQQVGHQPPVHFRAFSSDRSSMGGSLNGPHRAYSGSQIGSGRPNLPLALTSSMEGGLRHSLDRDLRPLLAHATQMQTQTQTDHNHQHAGLYNHMSMFGRMGMPDPMAPEFLPRQVAAERHANINI